ncbi:TIGR03773 family transporter-associated surface protein [Streptomyces sp. NPDC050704]|uniref:TIGR03773 family transporter-associated surface protein n=1 Tax=Streptomyces sp. NPDC050704 TaxID=3157219 RepID=UPI003443B4A5
MRDTTAVRRKAVRRKKIAAAVALAAAGAMAVAAAPEPRETAAAAVGRIALDERGIALGAPEDAVEIDDTHRTAVPEEEAYRFLGEPGAEVWELTDIPWDTTGVAPGAAHEDSVRWSLTGVEGPGGLAVYDVGADGEPVVRFDSADGLPDGYDLPAGARGDDGTRWAFGAPGTYTLTLAVEAESADGEKLSTQEAYTVLVGDEAIARAAEEPGTGAEPPLDAPSTGSPDAAEPPAADGAPATNPGALVTRPQAQAQAQPRTRAREAAAADDTAAVSERKVLDEGHVDFAARIVDNKLQIHIKDGTVSGKTTWREPSSVVMHVKPAARNTLPDSDDFAFLGKGGDPVWLLDQVQQEGLLWPGWSTDNIKAGASSGGVEFSLTKVDGPGTYALYTYDAMSGANVLFNSKDGVPDSFDVAQNTHAHGGWAFTKEGTYRLTFRMSGTLANGTKVSDTETVTFVVGDTDPGTVTPGDGSGKGPSGTPGTPDSKGTGGTADPASGSGSNSGSGSTGGSTGGSDGSMASTGAGQAVLLGSAAAALTAVGAGSFLAARRRRTARG